MAAEAPRRATEMDDTDAAAARGDRAAPLRGAAARRAALELIGGLQLPIAYAGAPPLGEQQARESLQNAVFACNKRALACLRCKCGVMALRARWRL
jgi:hypothetical protein